MPARLPLALLLCLAAAALSACQGAPNPSGAGGAGGAAPGTPTAAPVPAEPLQTSDPGSRSLPLGAPVGALPAETWPLRATEPPPTAAPAAPGASRPSAPPRPVRAR